MWYSNLYRRHLCDMHIDDWNPEFLSLFSPEEYVKNLTRAHINYAMLYFQSHAGLCYYPTKVGQMHRGLIGRESLMRDTLELCHSNNIKVIGYYSLQYNTREHDRHPQWRIVNPDGQSMRASNQSAGGALPFASAKSARYGLCCPNNAEYRRFVLEQVDEMLAYFACDALFFDMPFWPQTCYCVHCQKRWQTEFGGNIPLDPIPGSEDYLTLIQAKSKWMAEWVQALSAYIKNLKPQMPVEFNFASGIATDSICGCDERVNLACDYSNGDLYGGILEQSLACKFYKNISINQPFEYMFSRCKPSLGSHTLTKSLDEMKTAIAITAAHHGATLVIDAIDPIGTMDARVYEQLGRAFDMQIPFESYFKGEMLEDVGLYYGIKSKFNSHKESYTSKTCCVSAAETLQRNHIPFGVTGNFHHLNYTAIAAPMLSSLESDDNARLITYVKNGGVLYLSGGENKSLVEELTGGTVTGFTGGNRLYIAPRAPYLELFHGFNQKYPLPFDGTAPILQPEASKDVAATITFPYTESSEIRFASIHSDPPGRESNIPAVILKKYGKGTIIWSALPIESIQMEEYRRVFLSLLLLGQKKNSFSFSSNAPANVEITAFKTKEDITVNTVVLSNETISPAVGPFEIKVHTEQAPQQVLLLSKKKALPFSFADGFTTFRTRRFHIFEEYQILF